MPEYFLTQRYPTGLEDYFSVCWWERRGAGLSYSPDITPETMTVDRQVSDTLAVTNYLRRRFHQDKIYRMAHSGGAFFAIKAAAQAPELYHACTGVAQMTRDRFPRFALSRRGALSAGAQSAWRRCSMATDCAATEVSICRT